MPIQLQWQDTEQSIIYVRYERPWTWDDFYAAVEQSRTMTLSRPHRVDMIAHMTDNHLPKGASFAHSESAIKHKGPNMGVIVLVSSNRFITVLFGISARVSARWRESYRVANTLEDARAIIARERAAAARMERAPE